MISLLVVPSCEFFTANSLHLKSLTFSGSTDVVDICTISHLFKKNVFVHGCLPVFEVVQFILTKLVYT